MANSGTEPFVERRRPGRVDHTNPHLIALLRGKPARQDAAAEPDRGLADGAGSPGWPIVLLVLAIASWAVVGMLAWLVIRLQ
jgi:hypothetical protein